MALFHDAFARQQHSRWMRPDAARFIRPDAARFLKPGTRLEDVYPALAAPLKAHRTMQSHIRP